MSTLEEEWEAATPIKRKPAPAASALKPLAPAKMPGAEDGPAPVASEQRGPVETFARKASSAVSSNLVNPMAARISSTINGQPYDEALKGINESDASAAQDNPKAATAGTAAGTGLQLAAPIGGAAKSVGVASRALQAAKVGAGFGAAQGAGDALTAGGDAADALAAGAKGGTAGALLGGAAGAAGASLFRGAPGRVDARIVNNLARGEAGGAAKGKLVGNMIAKAGDDGSKLLPIVEDVGLTKSLATKAGAKPAKALADVEKVLDQNETKLLGPVYQAIDKAGTGPDATKVGTQLLDHADKLRAAGSPEQAAAIDRYVKFLGENYKPGQVLSGSMIRKLKGSIGSGAFQNLADENTALGVAVKREIYGVYSRAVEDAAAATPGVDMAALKTGNERASQLLGIKAVLADRAAKAAAGGSTMANAVMHGTHAAGVAGIIAHAIMSGGGLKEIGGLLAAEGGLQIAKRIPQMLRHVDLAASGVERAARANDLGAQIVREIGEQGAGRVAAQLAGDRLSRDDGAGDQ